MEIRQVTEDFSVSPQIDAGDMTAIAAAGFKTVINNRPDSEVRAEQQSPAMQAAAEAVGLNYVLNPVVNGGLTLEMVTKQGAPTAAADGPVLAWCRTGTRSILTWALSQAGKRPTAEIVEMVARAGYDMPMLAQQIDMLAER